jgi:hypothetical protein
MLRSSRSDAESGPLRMTASIQEGVRWADVAPRASPRRTLAQRANVVVALARAPASASDAITVTRSDRR